MTSQSNRDTVTPYRTKDGSRIRELMHPAVQGNRNQSLAEASVDPGGVTALHRHRETEELYHVTAGECVLTLGSEQIALRVGDTVCIPPGTPHRLENTGATELRVLCCSTPPYSHDDTELLDEALYE